MSWAPKRALREGFAMELGSVNACEKELARAMASEMLSATETRYYSLSAQDLMGLESGFLATWPKVTMRLIFTKFNKTTHGAN
jgi:hypothetical protein